MLAGHAPRLAAAAFLATVALAAAAAHPKPAPTKPAAPAPPEADLASVSSEELAAREGIAHQQALAAKLLRLQYEQGAPDRLRLLLEGKDAATVSRQLAYYGYIQRARAALITHLREEDARLAA